MQILGFFLMFSMSRAHWQFVFHLALVELSTQVAGNQRAYHLPSN